MTLTLLARANHERFRTAVDKPGIEVHPRTAKMLNQSHDRMDGEHTRTLPSDTLGTAQQEFIAAMRRLLGGSLGANILPSPFGARLSPKVLGLLAAIGYALIPALQVLLGSPPVLILLSCWGTVYLGVVVALTARTGQWVEETLETLIAPTMSDVVARAALAEITSGFKKSELTLISLITAVGFVALSWLILRSHSARHIVLWSVGYLYLYFAAALVTLTTRFHVCLSAALKLHPEELCHLRPASSPIVFALRALGNRMLRYWFCVFLLVMSLAGLPVVASRLGFTDVQGLTAFVGAAIAVAGFFSFVFGSLVYVRFESDLRNAVEQVRLRSLAAVQREYDQRFRAAAIDNSDKDRIEQLKDACEFLSTGALTRTVGSRVGSTLVGVLPAVAGILAAIVGLLKAAN